MGYLIDTTIFTGIEPRKPDPAAVSLIVEDDDLLISAMTVSELLAGVYRSSDSVSGVIRQTFVESVLRTFPILPFNAGVARVQAAIWSDMTMAGQIIGANDLIIATTAVAHNLTVFTDNRRDFSRVPGLAVVQPDWSKVS